MPILYIIRDNHEATLIFFYRGFLAVLMAYLIYSSKDYMEMSEGYTSTLGSVLTSTFSSTTGILMTGYYHFNDIPNLSYLAY